MSISITFRYLLILFLGLLSSASNFLNLTSYYFCRLKPCPSTPDLDCFCCIRLQNFSLLFTSIIMQATVLRNGIYSIIMMLFIGWGKFGDVWFYYSRNMLLIGTHFCGHFQFLSQFAIWSPFSNRISSYVKTNILWDRVVPIERRSDNWALNR